MGVYCYWKQLKKLAVDAHFHRRCQRRRKHDPLDLARLYYAVSPPERLHFLGMYPHEGITSVCGYSGEILPCSVHRLRKHFMVFYHDGFWHAIQGVIKKRSNPPITAAELTSSARSCIITSMQTNVQKKWQALGPADASVNSLSMTTRRRKNQTTRTSSDSLLCLAWRSPTTYFFGHKSRATRLRSRATLRWPSRKG